MKAEMDYRELVAGSTVLHFAVGILLLMLTSPCPAASPVESVRLVLPENPGAITRQAAGILARQIAERCDTKVVTAGEAAFSIELGVEPGIGTEGYEIADGPSGSVRIVGNDAVSLHPNPRGKRHHKQEPAMKRQNNCALAGKATSVAQGAGPSKAEEWRAVDSTIGQLLLLLSQALQMLPM